jgi:hypothetical protein
LNHTIVIMLARLAGKKANIYYFLRKNCNKYWKKWTMEVNIEIQLVN